MVSSHLFHNRTVEINLNQWLIHTCFFNRTYENKSNTTARSKHGLTIIISIVCSFNSCSIARVLPIMLKSSNNACEVDKITEISVTSKMAAYGVTNKWHTTDTSKLQAGKNPICKKNEGPHK